MAKKRKIKKAKLKAKAKRAVTAPTAMKSAYVLGIAGGLVILIAGILAILGIKIWGTTAIAASVINMAVGIISGLAILIATATAKKNPRLSGIVVLLFSLLALATPPTYGLIFGPVLSLIGAVLLLLRR
jgi:uncharacterized membrane protein